jgi:plastocyanin
MTGVLALVLSLLAGCGGDTGTTTGGNITPTDTPVAAAASATPTTATSACNATVTINNFSFSPDTLSVKAGTTIIWMNADPITHSVTDDNGGAAFNQLIADGACSKPVTLTKVGTIHYHCRIHPTMTASITVTA